MNPGRLAPLQRDCDTASAGREGEVGEQCKERVHVELTYHGAYSSRFLYAESLDHLEHIHHSLCLTPLNGGGYGTEHP